MKRWLLPFLALLLLPGGCSPRAQPVQQQFFAMDTVMSITAYGTAADEAAAAAVTEINRLESLLSRTREGSDIFRLNTEQTAEVSEDTARVLSLASEWHAKTGGVFDVTIAPIATVWGFGGSGAYRVPDRKELDSLLSLVDGTALTLNGTLAVLKQAPMEVDLGGIAKGYAAARAKQILAEHGVDFALLELGGSVTALGTRPDYTPWRIAVRDPADSGGTVGVLSLQDCSAVTSGAYQRYFEENGQIYHHIIDPRTGCPAASGLTSATVVCDDAALADLLSTAVFVLGAEDALSLWRAEGCFELVLATEDGRLIITEGLRDRFEWNEACGYTLEYAKK